MSECSTSSLHNMGNAVHTRTNVVHATCNVVGIHVHLLRHDTGKHVVHATCKRGLCKVHRGPRDAERGGNKCAFIMP